MGRLHVTMNEQMQCNTETLDDTIALQSRTHGGVLATRYFALKRHAIPASIIVTPCNDLKLQIGDQVTLTGERGVDGLFRATHIIVYLVKNHKILFLQRNTDALQGGAILEEKPNVGRTTQGWTGRLWLDGYPMSVSAQTSLLTAPTGTEIIYDLSVLRKARFQARPKSSSIAEPASSDLFQPNTCVIYNADRKANGHISATRLRLWPNDTSTQEKNYMRSVQVAVQLSTYSSHTPISIESKHDFPVDIVPDQAVQEWVSKRGEDLVPSYQRSLPKSDPTKIQFSFYIVHGSGAALKNAIIRTGGLRALRRPSFEEAALAMPNGLIVISDTALARIKNTAQLTAILSYAITTILQKHAYMTSRSSVGVVPFDMTFPQFAFAVLKDEQSLRIGIRQMYLAGYDIREAPFAWAVAQGKPVNNPVIDSKNPDKEIPWYAAYAFNYISQYYKDVDYSKLKRGRKEYQQFLQELYKADPTLKRPKAQGSTQ